MGMGPSLIPILHPHIFRLFLTHPPYVDINSTERQKKKCHFSDSTHPVPLLTWYRDGPKNTVILDGPYDIKREKENIVLVLKLL